MSEQFIYTTQYAKSRSAKNSNWVRLKVGQTSPTTLCLVW